MTFNSWIVFAILSSSASIFFTKFKFPKFWCLSRISLISCTIEDSSAMCSSKHNVVGFQRKDPWDYTWRTFWSEHCQTSPTCLAGWLLMTARSSHVDTQFLPGLSVLTILTRLVVRQGPSCPTPPSPGYLHLFPTLPQFRHPLIVFKCKCLVPALSYLRI